VLNLPYSDSESDPPAGEGGELAEDNAQIELEAPTMDIPETEVPTMEASEASTSRRVSKAAKIQELENGIMELKFLDKHIKSVNETLKKTSDETRDTCDQVALMYVKLEKKNTRLSKKSQRMYKVIKALRYTLAPRRLKRRVHQGLEVLVEAAEAYNQ